MVDDNNGFGMKPASDSDRNYESTFNDALAQSLRERCEASGFAEELRDGSRPDIIARLPDGPVIL